jgi:[ribosomal protein S5]-alanine N-acetyltransferase
MLQFSLTPFPERSTERLVLRRVTMSDVNELFFLRSNAQVMEYIKKAPCQSLEEAAAFVDKIETALLSDDCLQWGMSLKGDTKLIGLMGIWRFDKAHYRGEIGYSVMPAYWGQGLTSEAMAATIDYGFRVLGLHTIEANIDPGNLASQHLLEKHGFEREGYQRENYFFEGKFYDTACYSLITPFRT